MKRKNLLYLIFLVIFLVILFLLLITCHNKKQETYHFEVIKNKDDIELSPRLSEKDKNNVKLAQAKLKNMLKIFNDICDREGFEYFATGGTMLGAYLYEGIIPWDLDIDVAVNEKDFDKLAVILQKELPENMFFQSSKNDKNYSPDSTIVGKIRDKNSCYIEWTNKTKGGKKWHNGLQIDVIIFRDKGNKVEVPNDKLSMKRETVYPLKKKSFDGIPLSVMNNSEKILVYEYGKKCMKILPLEERFSHEGLVDPVNTCPHHYDLYPEIYHK